jgi:hypothetical protein
VAYIRSNEDWYRSMGISPFEVKVQDELDRRGVDYGVCNPIKAKRAAEVEEEIRRELTNEQQH